MKKVVAVVIFSLICGFSFAETANEPNTDRNIFAVTQPVLVFDDEKELINYIKSNKPSTFKYYDRLDQQAKKQVFRKHQDNQEADITEIVLQVYRTNR